MSPLSRQVDMCEYSFVSKRVNWNSVSLFSRMRGVAVIVLLAVMAVALQAATAERNMKYFEREVSAELRFV